MTSDYDRRMAVNQKHFLDLKDLSGNVLRKILSQAVDLKSTRQNRKQLLNGKTLAMIFEKPSTRTRVSFEVGMKELGGDVVVLSGDELQVSRGESIADTARVLSRYVDGIMIRTFEEAKIREMAKYASVPVINGLTDNSHPCQLMADVMTFEEHRGSIKGKTVAWSGDGNNMASSWIHAATKFDFKLNIACPRECRPDEELLDWANKEKNHVNLFHDPKAAVENADCVVTDTWVSMGRDDSNRHNLLSPFQVNKKLMENASPEAVFLHCLPAHRGEEVTSEVLDGPRSLVWDEAENRLHAQKAILLWCGTSLKMVKAKLAAKGFERDVISRVLDDISGEQEELEAAFLVARRKRLGPYREKKEREANRNRDLGVLSQAGFPYSISKQVIDTFET